MKQSTINNIRNWIHPFAVAVLFLRIGLVKNLSYDMTADSKVWTIIQMILVSLFGGGLFGTLLGAIYEVPYKSWIFKEPIDVYDILRSGLGGPIGFALACSCPLFPIWLVNTLLYIVLIIFFADLVLSIRRKINSKN